MGGSIPDRPPAAARPSNRPNLVQFDFAGWRFSAQLVPILCAVLVLPILISLGFWQLGRAAERQALLDGADAARKQKPLPVDDARLSEAAPRYLPVTVSGRFDASRQFLLDNRVHGRVAGYEVLLPVIYKPGKAILVNRGWLPVGGSREVKPDIGLALVSGEFAGLAGLAVVPPERFSLGDALSDSDDWPKVLQHEDFEAISALLELDVLPRIVQPGQVDWGFESIWTPLQKGPEQNYAYALQWFALAMTLILIVLALCVRRRQETT